MRNQTENTLSIQMRIHERQIQHNNEQRDGDQKLIYFSIIINISKKKKHIDDIKYLMKKDRSAS